MDILEATVKAALGTEFKVDFFELNGYILAFTGRYTITVDSNDPRWAVVKIEAYAIVHPTPWDIEMVKKAGGRLAALKGLQEKAEEIGAEYEPHLLRWFRTRRRGSETVYGSTAQIAAAIDCTKAKNSDYFPWQ